MSSFLKIPLLLCTAALLTCTARSEENPIVVGNARFTVITPECIRIEYAPDGKFIDAKSLFAVDREARSSDFTLKKSPSRVVIETLRIRLIYTPDGQPLNTANLGAVIRKGKEFVEWAPGVGNPGNLGGTITTLDMITGPVDLGQGLLSRDGWFLLDDSRSQLFTSDWVESRPEDSGTDWYLFGYGDDYKSALKSFITIGGAAPMPRRYALGIWFSRYWKFTTDEFKAIVDEYKQHNFPLDVMVMDMDWHRQGWTGWSWNFELIPDPKALLAWFHEQGLHVTLNLHPADGVAPHEDKYADFMTAMGEDPNSGQTLPFDAGSKKYMDAFLDKVLNPLREDGADFWWLDWQQYPFTRSIPDLTNLAWLNVMLFRSTETGGERGISLSRWAGWGDHRHPIQFSGDADTGWEMLSFEVPFTSTAGNVGCYYWSHDIGGHTGGRNEESYTRWVQFGSMTAAIRSHSESKPDMDRRPWMYPRWAEDSMRVAFHLRAEMMPYVYSSARQTFASGVSLNRPLYLEYPNLEESYRNGQEFLFGDSLLVAPITMPGAGPGRVGRQLAWFPPGDTWFNVFTGEAFSGGQSRVVSADINEFPLFAKGGVPIPMQPFRERPGTAPLDVLRVRCYPGAEGRTGKYELYEDDGWSEEYKGGAFAVTPLTYSRKGDQVTVTVGPAKGSFKNQLTKRAYEIELANTQSATEILVNGKSAQTKYDAALGINTISIPESAIGEALTIVAKAADASPKAFAAVALSRRLQGVLGAEGGRKTLQDALALGNLGGAEKAAVLGLAGVALLPHHDTPTFFGGKNNLALQAPSGLLERDQIALVTEEKNSAGNLAERRANASFAPIGSAKPPVADAEAYGRFEFKILGRPHSLETPCLRMVGNLAPTATLSASSSENGHSPDDAVDGRIGGYPSRPDAEWSANRETTGCWIELNWPKPQSVRKIVLYDRPNRKDQVTSGIITFSDGTKMGIGVLPNDGAEPLVLEFPPRSTSSLRFEITGVRNTTENSGFSEIGVY